MKPEAVVWGYRLFLDREPENDAVVADKSKSLSSSQELRREFLQSDEFRAKNSRTGFLAPLSGNEPPMDIDVVYDLQELFFHTKDVWEHLGETEPYSVCSCVRTFQTFRNSRDPKRVL